MFCTSAFFVLLEQEAQHTQSQHNRAGDNIECNGFIHPGNGTCGVEITDVTLKDTQEGAELVVSLLWQGEELSVTTTLRGG